MSKSDKKSPPNASNEAAETTPETVETVETVETPSTVEVVPDVPTGALTQRQLNESSAAGATIAQYESGLLDLETRILEIAAKYPEWEPGILDALSRYGTSGGDEAFDVNVRAPGMYIRLRHGMSRNVPEELNVNVGAFFTADRNLGKSFDAIMLYAHEVRKYFVGTELTSPECQSHDAKYGSRYGECSQCPYSAFDEAKKKSDCAKGYSIMWALPDFSVIGEMTFTRTSAASGRQIIQRMMTMREGRANWITTISTHEKQSGAHKNAVPTGGLPKERTTAEQREVAGELTKFFKLRALYFAAKSAERRAKGLGGGGSSGALGSGDAGGSETEVPLL